MPIKFSPVYGPIVVFLISTVAGFGVALGLWIAHHVLGS